MLKVRSLKHTIILQFVLIITPIVLVVMYQAVNDARRASAAQFERRALQLSQQAEDHYKVYLNGLVDAVDSGRISNKAVRALADSKSALLNLKSMDADGSVEVLLDSIDSLLSTAQRDPTIELALPLRPVINHAREGLKNLVIQHSSRVQRNIETFTQETNRQVWIVLIVTLMTLASAGGFIYRMIKGLTEPLNRAVTLAEKIAAGDFKSDEQEDTDQDIGGLLGSLASMRTDLRNVFLDLGKNEARLANAQRIAEIGDWELDFVSGAMTRSQQAYSIFGRERDALSESGIPVEIVHQDDRLIVEKSLSAGQHRHEPFSIDFRIDMPNGDIRHIHGEAEIRRDDKGEAIAMAGTVQDITLRKLAENQIQHLALHDALTGLPNRALFTAQLEKALAIAERSKQTLATMFLDLDRFKNVNDSLGHQIGDDLLKEAGDRITKCLRKSDIASHEAEPATNGIVARMGGDEFTLLLTNLRHAEDSARVAERILASLALPFSIAGNEVVVSASIGIAVYPMDGVNSGSLLKNADSAMYHAKAQGRNNYQFSTDTMKTEATFRLSMESDLRKALVENQFLLHYQPQIDIGTQQIFGAEALIRWQHPQRGLVPPLEFIPLAEEYGLIAQIGEWVLREACRQTIAWHNSGLPKIHIAINMASPSFRQPNFSEIVLSALAESGLTPNYLELEVTESIMMQELDFVIPILKSLRDVGIQLSIDDFGTGYSSLSYLQNFPLDALKIDRAFVRNLGTPEGAAIVQAIIAMANSLNLDVIAEGVETEAQAEFLLQNNCKNMQGFLFSKPLPAAEMTRLLQSACRNDSPAVIPA